MVTDQRHREASAVVLRAVSKHSVFGSMLLLKGALAVEAVTRSRRATRDIDLTAAEAFVSFDQSGEKTLKAMFRECLENHLDAGNDADWTLNSTSVRKKPKGIEHPFGWDGYTAKVTLLYRGSQQHVVPIDLSFGDFTGYAITIDCSSTALAPSTGLSLFELRAYSTEEQIAEKLRAFLQKRPEHLRKIGADPLRAEYRVRDIWDVHHLVDAAEAAGMPPDWVVVGDSFAKKCRAKLVDCSGASDFPQAPDELATIEGIYDHEFGAVASQEVPFELAWATFRRAVDEFGAAAGFPGRTPVPDQQR